MFAPFELVEVMTTVYLVCVRQPSHKPSQYALLGFFAQLSDIPRSSARKKNNLLDVTIALEES